jgi:hypothetical protein
LLDHDRLRPSVSTRHLHGQDAVSELLCDRCSAVGVEFDPPGRGEPPPRAQHVVAGADDLGARRRERAQLPGRFRTCRGQHERRLGLIELTRNRAHHRFLDPFGFGDDGQWIAGQRRVGEHVDQEEGNGCAHHVSLMTFSPALTLRWAGGRVVVIDQLGPEGCDGRGS